MIRAQVFEIIELINRLIGSLSWRFRELEKTRKWAFFGSTLASHHWLSDHQNSQTTLHFLSQHITSGMLKELSQALFLILTVFCQVFDPILLCAVLKARFFSRKAQQPWVYIAFMTMIGMYGKPACIASVDVLPIANLIDPVHGYESERSPKVTVVDANFQTTDNLLESCSP